MPERGCSKDLVNRVEVTRSSGRKNSEPAPDLTERGTVSNDVRCQWSRECVKKQANALDNSFAKVTG